MRLILKKNSLNKLLSIRDFIKDFKLGSLNRLLFGVWMNLKKI